MSCFFASGTSGPQLAVNYQLLVIDNPPDADNRV